MGNTKALDAFREMRELADRLRELLGDAEFEYDEIYAQLAEAHAQLAAERDMADMLASWLVFMVKGIDQKQIKNTSIIDRTKGEPKIITLKETIEGRLQSFMAHKATRQPTQDKGE